MKKVLPQNRLWAVLFLSFFTATFLYGQDVQLANNPGLGQILTDANGYTLYFFARDAAPDASACSGGCAGVWPVFYVENPTVAGGLDAADFDAFQRSDGAMQTTYKGWPLYRFVSDSSPGTTNGDGVSNVWFVAKPDYSVMLMNNQFVGHNGVMYNSNYEEGMELVQYFVDAAGRTLYTFSFDNYDQNNFTAADFSNNGVWPVYEEDLQEVPSSLDPSLFNTIDVFGHQQLTYNGWPLYYFGQDAAKGETKGVSFPAPGIWPAAVEGIAEAPAGINVSLSDDPTLGQILTDGDGNTLYFFTRDETPDASACSGGCAGLWPAFYEETLVLDAGLDAADFGAFQRADGAMQTTYKGWPLYRFANDTAPGETNGEAFNNIWFVAKPDYGIMLMNNQLVGLDGVMYNGNYEEGMEVVQYFVDASGRTLYVFSNDNFEQNNFTAADLSNNGIWPVFEDDLQEIPSILDESLFGTIDVFGLQQLTYKGWPMYQFVQDAARGETKGVSVPVPGVWPVVVADIAEAPAAINVSLSDDPTLGQILTDGDGNTLYFFTRDETPDASACSGGCAGLWPAFYEETLVLDAGLDAADFGAFQRADGAMQTTYKGWPLYRFANDAAPGDTNGEAFNNVWFVAKPDYGIMLMNNQLVGLDGVMYNGNYEEGMEVVQYFVDASGRTLYVFSNDNFEQNNFTAADLSNNGIWPVFEDDLQEIPSILDESLFGTIDVFGLQQLTYKGWPMYQFVQDAARGETKGVSVPVPGVWPVVVADIAEAPAAINVSLSDDPTLGQILTDGDGNTLYFFTRDETPDASACSGGCAGLWPAFYEETLVLDAGLDAADFGAFQRADGAMQTTYKGWPLYHFANDTAPGETNGEAFNNIWFVAKPDYGIMLMNNQLVGLDGVMYNGDYEEGTEDVQYFVDAEGRTIYIFIVDTYDQNNYTLEDFSNNGVWPIYEEDLQEIPSTLDESLFNTIDVFGRQQLTYKGWPLYYFGQDAARGETKGVSVPSPGIWPVAEPDLDSATIVSVREIEAITALDIYPNPFAEQLTVRLELEQAQDLQLSLFNQLGQQVVVLWEGELNTGTTTMNFEDLKSYSPGLYYLQILSKSGNNVHYQKLIRK